MAKLTKCKTCGGKLSSSATVCPHCGEEIKKKKGNSSAWLLAIFIIGFLIVIAMPDNGDHSYASADTATEPNPTPEMLAKQKEENALLTSQKAELIDRVKEEKWVFGPTWESDDVLSIGMFDDGTRRDGFAQYICVLKNEVGLEGHRILIKIYDAKLMMNSGEAKVIGETACN